MDDMPIGRLGQMVRYLEDGGCLALLTAGKHLWGSDELLACGCRQCVCDACGAVLVTHWCHRHRGELERQEQAGGSAAFRTRGMGYGA